MRKTSAEVEDRLCCLSCRVSSVWLGLSRKPIPLHLKNTISPLPVCSKAGFWMLIPLSDLAPYLAVSLLSGSAKVFVPHGSFCTSWSIFSRSSWLRVKPSAVCPSGRFLTRTLWVKAKSEQATWVGLAKRSEASLSIEGSQVGEPAVLFQCGDMPVAAGTPRALASRTTVSGWCSSPTSLGVGSEL